jgi:hypothetical protein
MELYEFDLLIVRWLYPRSTKDEIIHLSPPSARASRDHDLCFLEYFGNVYLFA